MKVKTLKQTCVACPSQWEGFLTGGEELYVRYRWGGLRVDINGDTFHSREIGDGLDGYLEQSRMLDILRELGFEIDDTSEIGEEIEIDW